MKKTNRIVPLIILVLVAVLTACGGGGQSEPIYENPSFVGFDVDPNSVCSDLGPGLVGVEWEADPGDSEPETDNFPSCVYLDANGRSVAPRQCLDDGLTGGYTINIHEIFGTTIPNQITIRARLCGGVGCDLESANNDYDRASEVITSQICGDAPGNPGAGG